MPTPKSFFYLTTFDTCPACSEAGIEPEQFRLAELVQEPAPGSCPKCLTHYGTDAPRLALAYHKLERPLPAWYNGPVCERDGCEKPAVCGPLCWDCWPIAMAENRAAHPNDDEEAVDDRLPEL